MLRVLAVIMVVFIFGLVAVENNWWRSTLPARETLSAQTQAVIFMSYRNAVIAYLEANLSTSLSSGTVPDGDIVLPNGLAASTLPSSLTNYYSISGSTITVYVFESSVPGIVQVFNQDFPGDQTLGVDNAGEWTADPGGASAAVPGGIGVVNGDILSVVQIGGYSG